MFKSFFWKNWFFVLLLTSGFLVLMLGILVNYQFQKEKNRFLEHHLDIAQITAHTLERGYKIGIWPFETLSRVGEAESTSFLWVVKPDNRIFWADDFRMMDKTVPISYDLQTKIKESFFYEPVKLITLPIETELGKEPWALLFGVSLRPISKAKQEILILSSILLLLILALAGFVSYFLSKKITHPLKCLQQSSEIIGKGNLEHRIKIKTGDEIEQLATSFNQMTENLQKSYSALEEARTVLEIKVQARTKELKELAEQREIIIKERTKELQERVKELERFHRLAVGRELKMIELKEEIKKLKEELKKGKFV